MRKWLVPLLVIAGLLIAAVPAAANGDPGWETWTEDASCEEVFGFVGVALWVDEDEPAVEVPVIFTWNGSDFGPYYTNEDGVIYTIWGYTPGEGEVTVGISAEGWGYTEATFSGPDECEGNPVPSVQVSWPCGQEAADITFTWTGEFDGMSAYISTEGDERYDESEGNSLTFSELIPGATYYYSTQWWTEKDGWGFTEGYFDVPEACTVLAVADPWVDAYNLIKYRNTDSGRPVELKALFWIYVPPGFTAAWEPSVLRNCNTGKLVPTAVDAVKAYECTHEMALAGLIKNLGVVHVQINVLTGEVRSDDPDWPTSAYNPHWFGK